MAGTEKLGISGETIEKSRSAAKQAAEKARADERSRRTTTARG